MARRTPLALQRQLRRERTHLQWLEQHLPQSVELARCQQHIAELALKCALISDSKHKKRCSRNAHQSHNLVHDYISEQAEDR